MTFKSPSTSRISFAAADDVIQTVDSFAEIEGTTRTDQINEALELLIEKKGGVTDGGTETEEPDDPFRARLYNALLEERPPDGSLVRWADVGPDLAQRFSKSTSTLKSHLNLLENEGYIKAHGGRIAFPKVNPIPEGWGNPKVREI